MMRAVGGFLFGGAFVAAKASVQVAVVWTFFSIGLGVASVYVAHEMIYGARGRAQVRHPVSVAHATFTAAVDNLAVINPGEVAVTVHVTNTGKAAGKPKCTINANDSTGTYSGTGVVALRDPVGAGKTTTFVGHVTIARQGARRVNLVAVTCS